MHNFDDICICISGILNQCLSRVYFLTYYAALIRSLSNIFSIYALGKENSGYEANDQADATYSVVDKKKKGTV